MNIYFMFVQFFLSGQSEHTLKKGTGGHDRAGELTKKLT